MNYECICTSQELNLLCFLFPFFLHTIQRFFFNTTFRLLFVSPTLKIYISKTIVESMINFVKINK